MTCIGETTKSKSSFAGFLLLSMVLAAIFIIVVLMPLEPSDYWTYLRIGDQIVRTHSIPATEFMTYTSGGEPANFSYWLASLVLLGIYKAGGLTLTALVMGLCVVGLYVCIWLCLRELKLGPVSVSLVLLITALMGSNNWSTRPQNFALPLFGLTLLILLKWQHGHSRMLWLLPIVTVFWVNLHGSFILLFVLLFTALIFGLGSRKLLSIVILLSLAATLINPFGFHLWTNTTGMIGSDLIKTYSSEWQPPMNQGWQLNLFFGSLLVMALAAAFSKVKVKLLWWVLFLGFGWMALSSLRYVLWFSLIEALLLAQLAAPWLERFLDPRPVFLRRSFNLTLGVLVLVFPLAFLPGIRHQWWAQAPAALTDTTPVQAVEWIKEHPELPEHIWANWVASIYMSYALPERPVWITNRIEDFDERIFLDNKSLMRASYDWQSILDGYGVNVLLLDQANEKPLITAVSSSSNWIEIYRDERELIFMRADQN
ncbi:MAG: hypothetical protein C0410_02630 [Anaerolinea sp.]|nr:hypothetical protein [Anaerolinea sp.]